MAEAVMAIGAVTTAFGQFKQSRVAEKQEKMRKRQMNLEAARRQRDIIREGIRARAVATSNATAQGAGEGSGLQGGLAQVTSNTTRNLSAVRQDQQIGNKMFNLAGNYAQWGTVASIGQGISSVGQAWQSANQKGG